MSEPRPSLPPGAERRIGGWQEIQYRLTHTRGPALRPTITISRQFGCAAFALAERLRDKLQVATQESWKVYDRALIEKVAQEEGISPILLKNLGDPSSDPDVLSPSLSDHVTHDEAFEKVAVHLLGIAREGNAILIGRGGSILCEAMDNCFHFRLEAGLEWRVMEVMDYLKLDQEEARRLISTHATHREKFLADCTGGNVADIHYYDAVFNNERHSLDEIAVAILAYVRLGWPDKSYFRH